MEKTLVLILEDAAIIRNRIIEMLLDLKVDQFLEADSAQGAVHLFAVNSPQVAILDIQVLETCLEERD